MKHVSSKKAIVITDGTPQDIVSIIPIMESAFDPEYGEAWNTLQCHSMLSLPYSKLKLAHYNNIICGFAFTRGIYEDEELLMLATHPEFQRQGIAATLMDHIIEQARKDERHHIFIEMRTGNTAEAFYDRYQFKKTAFREKYYRGISGSYYDAITKKMCVS